MSEDKRANRRTFLKTSAAVAALAAGEGAHGKSAGRTKPIRLGAPVFPRPKNPEALALAHKKMGYRAAYCPHIPLKDTDRIRATAAAFAKHDIALAEVGVWCNLLDADSTRRKANLRRVTDGLALAEAIGARCCVDIAGSFNKKAWHGPHPKNLSTEFFDAAVANARAIVDAIKPKRAKFCYEMMGWSIPDSVESYLKLIKAVDRKGFGVHLDPCNLINSPSRYYDTTAMINECFDKLGKWIVSCHAKDVTWDVEMQMHFREVPIGQGTLDYRTYLKRLAALPNDPPLMIEHMKGAEEYDKCRRHLLDVARKIGVTFR